MRTNIITSTTTSVFGIRQDRIVKAGNDRCAQAHARLLPAWHMHVAMAWTFAAELKHGVKQAWTAAAHYLAGSNPLVSRPRSVESVVVRSTPRASVRRG